MPLWMLPLVYVPKSWSTAHVREPRDAQAAIGEVRGAAPQREVADVGDAQREGGRRAPHAEHEVGAEQLVVAQLIGLADLVDAKPELVGTSRARQGERRRERERDDGDAGPAHPRRTVTRG